MNNDLQDAIGRIVWRDGQDLASRDLNGELRDEARRRRLHVRMLHQTWGIALGFQANLDASGTAVVVSPGYAVDIEGRELLLSPAVRIALPGDGDFVLAATYDASSACAPVLPAVEFCPGLPPRRERAVIGWVAMTGLKMGEHVPLARVVMANGAPVGGLNLNVRRMARRMIRPHLGAGITETGATNWVDQAVNKKPDIWLQADVDTSEAGFLKTPRYQACLCRQGPPHKHPRKGSLDETAALFGKLPALNMDGLGVITNATSKKFTYRVPRAAALPWGADLTAGEAEKAGWVIAWVGVETVAGCQPEINLQAAIAVLGILI